MSDSVFFVLDSNFYLFEFAVSYIILRYVIDKIIKSSELLIWIYKLARKQAKKKEMHKAWEGFFVTADWVIYAVALTLVFLVFIMRAYTIPTGSMADTLRGAHFRIRCTQCGYRYDYDFLRPAYGITNQGTPSKEVPIKPGSPQCPSCGFYHQTARQGTYGNLYYPEELYSPIISGDRIFVYKLCS